MGNRRRFISTARSRLFPVHPISSFFTRGLDSLTLSLLSLLLLLLKVANIKSN